MKEVSIQLRKDNIKSTINFEKFVIKLNFQIKKIKKFIKGVFKLPSSHPLLHQNAVIPTHNQENFTTSMQNANGKFRLQNFHGSAKSCRVLFFFFPPQY